MGSGAFDGWGFIDPNVDGTDPDYWKDDAKDVVLVEAPPEPVDVEVGMLDYLYGLTGLPTVSWLVDHYATDARVFVGGVVDGVSAGVGGAAYGIGESASGVVSGIADQARQTIETVGGQVNKAVDSVTSVPKAIATEVGSTIRTYFFIVLAIIVILALVFLFWIYASKGAMLSGLTVAVA